MNRPMCVATYCGIAAAMLVALVGFCLPSAQAQTEPGQKMRIVGGLAGTRQYTRQEEPFWTKELARLSNGKFSAEIVPFDRAGVPGQDMLRLMKLGVVSFGTLPLNRIAAQDAEFNAPDLAGLNPDMTTLRKNVAAFRPYMEQTLRERYGIELLAVYVYPAQVLFCKQSMASLTDLASRRIRVSSVTGADFVEAFGGIPVLTGFAEIMPSMATGNIDCAITGTMSGNTIGLQEVTTHIHPVTVTWGLSIFAANSAAWKGVRPELKALLQTELPKLEAAIWNESDRETAEGIACNVGAASCTDGQKGKMVAIGTLADDERRRREVFLAKVLPRWLQRCGTSCAQVWNQTIGPVSGIKAPIR
jgi:TRAP-type C4-dicarboxylate transport system substrate-binding protein